MTLLVEFALFFAIYDVLEAPEPGRRRVFVKSFITHFVACLLVGLLANQAVRRFL